MFDPITASPEQLLRHSFDLECTHINLTEIGAELNDLANQYGCTESRFKLDRINADLCMIEVILEESEPFVRLLH